MKVGTISHRLFIPVSLPKSNGVVVFLPLSIRQSHVSYKLVEIYEEFVMNCSYNQFIPCGIMDSEEKQRLNVCKKAQLMVFSLCLYGSGWVCTCLPSEPEQSAFKSCCVIYAAFKLLRILWNENLL